MREFRGGEAFILLGHARAILFFQFSGNNNA
jgi:hypothetical protein